MLPAAQVQVLVHDRDGSYGGPPTAKQNMYLGGAVPVEGVHCGVALLAGEVGIRSACGTMVCLHTLERTPRHFTRPRHFCGNRKTNSSAVRMAATARTWPDGGHSPRGQEAAS